MANIIDRPTTVIENITAPPQKLDEHILGSYSTLRWAMGGLGLILPPLLVVGGLSSVWWLSTPLDVQNSLSAYYHAGSAGSSCTALEGVYRDLFVGILTAISACLIIYSGFGKLEDWLLNFAGVFLAGVAFFPMGWPEQQLIASCRNAPEFRPFEASQFLGLPISLHAVSAVLFFMSITAVNIFTAMDTVKFLEKRAKDTSNRDLKSKLTRKAQFWRRIYRVVKFLMPISLGLVLLLSLFGVTGDRLILWIEWAGIWAFSLYWLIKSIEILRSGVDRAMIHGNIKRDPKSRALR